jgi:hypothetical protein
VITLPACFSHVQCQTETFFSTSPFGCLLINCNLNTQCASVFNRNPFSNYPLIYWTLKASFMSSWQTKTQKKNETTVEKLKKGTGNRGRRWWRAENMEGMEESNTENCRSSLFCTSLCSSQYASPCFPL